jgi:hypothetical protein
MMYDLMRGKIVIRILSLMIIATADIVRQRSFFCACDNPKRRFDHALNICEPEFLWYEPQDIIKGIGIAKKRGYPDGFWVPYKICGGCRWNKCVSQYL